jgi:hypothetical protein
MNNQSWPQSVYPISGDVQSSVGSQTVTVTGLQGVSIAATAPSFAQTLQFNGSQWTPGLNFSPVSLTGQSANISATTILTPAINEAYQISAYIIVTTAGSVSSTLPAVTITWTDADNATSQSFALTPTNTSNLLTTFEQATMVLNAAAGNAIQYATSGYAANAATSMKYSLYIRTLAL